MTLHPVRTLLLRASLPVVLLVLGAACAEKPHQTELAPPVGSYVRLWQQKQISKADADRFVIYTNYWNNISGDGVQLNPGGRRQVARMAQQLSIWPYPVIIQPVEDDAELNQMRREVIVRYLIEREVPHADNRVVIDYPIAEGSYAEDLTTPMR